MTEHESFFDLVKQAKQMLLDRPKPHQDLIYHIASLQEELRSAIVVAYRDLYDEF